MKTHMMQFPQYRMLSNGKTFYKIIDERNFEEIQISGSKIYRYKFVAEKYPEILKIKDLLNVSDQIYIEINEQKWLEFEMKI